MTNEQKFDEALARRIATEIGDDFDQAFDNKTAWVRAGGGDPYRDANLPFKTDYLCAARATKAMVLAMEAARTPAPAHSTPCGLCDPCLDCFAIPDHTAKDDK